jgi:uncharacterized Zn-finger protein
MAIMPGALCPTCKDALMTMPDAPETEVVTTWKVACDGGEGALGHPRVWLTIPEDRGWVECGYCDKRYIHESDVKAAPQT